MNDDLGKLLGKRVMVLNPLSNWNGHIGRVVAIYDNRTMGGVKPYTKEVRVYLEDNKWSTRTTLLDRHQVKVLDEIGDKPFCQEMLELAKELKVNVGSSTRVTRFFETFEELSEHLINGGRARKASWDRDTHIFLKNGEIYIDRRRGGSRFSTVGRETVIYDGSINQEICDFYPHSCSQKVTMVRYFDPKTGETTAIIEGLTGEKDCIKKGWKKLIQQTSGGHEFSGFTYRVEE